MQVPLLSPRIPPGDKTMPPDKRKHTRVRHRAAVELTSENSTFSGTSVNLSMSGMQVVVRLPASYDSIRSITFQIPGSDERVRLPCRLIRDSEHDVVGGQVLGLEFLSEADAQLLLIEKFIQDTQPGRADARQLPRTSCHLDDVTAVGKNLHVLSIDNLSTEGLLLNYHGSLEEGQTLALSVGVPGDERRLTLSGTVAYVIDNMSRRSLTAGLRLSKMKETEESRLRNLIVTCSSVSALRGLHDRLDAVATEPESRITDTGQIGRVFESLKGECVRLSVLMDGSFTIGEHEIERVDENLRQFAFRQDRELATSNVAPGMAAYLAFYWNKGSHYFKAELISARDGLLTFPLPSVVFRTDKRSYQRKPLYSARVDLMVPGEAAGPHTFEGTLIDISRRGFLCELRVPAESRAFFREGNILRYAVEEGLSLGTEGQIRHVKEVPSPQGVMLQIGVEAGIIRSSVNFRRIPANTWNSGADAPHGPDRRIESLWVRFPDRAGHEICAFVNATELHVKAPVVIIPPAYGKKKEALAPLVSTLLASFWNEGKDIVTLRYDAINRPGESHQDDPHPRRGYEMLSYRITQGLGDLRAALDFVRDNPHFAAEKVIVVSFSMSAIDVRRLLSQEKGSGVDYWISCMGVPSAQTALRSILGGIDIITNYRLGIPNGFIGLLGHLLDMDAMATDVLEEKYAFLTDARLDMSKIAVPVLWICGLYDKWVDMDEVMDVMSVKAPGRREVLEIPTGHNLRTSDDAIETFKLITGSLYEELYGTPIVVCDPSKEEMIRLLTAERERLQNRAAPPLDDYWRGYLLGNERNQAGYDFYRNIPEFMDFLRMQARCLALGNEEIIADLGCGTGLFLEALLKFIAEAGERISVREITAVDLVPDALEKARAKCEEVLASNARLRGISFRYVQKNLEPNRLIPVSRLVESATPSLDSLRDRIEGLSSAMLDRLIEKACPELYALMRGAQPESKLVSRLESTLEPVELQTVLELNRAARYLLGKIGERDGKPGRIPGKVHLESLRTSDLFFERLNFGDHDSNLGLGFPGNHFTRIVASLFISYLQSPDYVLAECHRMLKPGGVILVSSMKPDSDLSMMFTNYIRKIRMPDCLEDGEKNEADGASGARAMLNAAASLFELEEDGFFKFYRADELKKLLSGAGFVEIATFPSMGDPPQAHIAIARKY